MYQPMTSRYRSSVYMFIVLAVLTTGAVMAEEMPVRRAYLLPGGQVLALAVPPAWIESPDSTQSHASFSIKFSPPAGPAFRVVVSVIDQRGRLLDVRAIVERSGRERLSSGMEDRLILEDLRGPRVKGYFYRLTDRAPKPDEYTYLVQGAMSLRDLLLTFTILTNQAGAAEVTAALEMLRTAEAARGV